MGLLVEIRRIIEDYLNNTTWTSASPNHTNTRKDISYSYEPDPASLDDSSEPFEPTQLPQSQDVKGQATGIDPSDFTRRQGKQGVTFTPGEVSTVDILHAGSIAKNPLGFFNKIGGLAKMIPIITAIIAIPASIKLIADLLRAPGGPFDIRFKRDIQDEIFQSVERDTKAKIRQGLTLIRFTSSPTLRGEMGVGQTGQVGLTGIARYDQDFEEFRKLGIP